MKKREEKFRKLVKKIVTGLSKLPKPIHLLAVCTGGITVAKAIALELRKRKIKANYFEVWTNVKNGKRSIWKTNFKPHDYIGTAVIVEDVIWRGSAIPPIKKMLNNIKKRKVYVAAFLDYNKKADFSYFS